mmetsp:Transcript_51003/g.157955  ORF Transcript_51003/g.157955 Transcript_51003/m.157955 type:complete len:214 (+) Transcript_51003:1-642(+)
MHARGPPSLPPGCRPAQELPQEARAYEAGVGHRDAHEDGDGLQGACHKHAHRQCQHGEGRAHEGAGDSSQHREHRLPLLHVQQSGGHLAHHCTEEHRGKEDATNEASVRADPVGQALREGRTDEHPRAEAARVLDGSLHLVAAASHAEREQVRDHADEGACQGGQDDDPRLRAAPPLDGGCQPVEDALGDAAQEQEDQAGEGADDAEPDGYKG